MPAIKFNEVSGKNKIIAKPAMAIKINGPAQPELDVIVFIWVKLKFAGCLA
jgi:hypothetical protein